MYVFRAFKTPRCKNLFSSSKLIHIARNVEFRIPMLVSIIDVTIALKPVTRNKLAHNDVSIDTRRNKIYSAVIEGNETLIVRTVASIVLIGTRTQR